MPELTLHTVQSEAYANKVAKGFNISDVPMEFCLTIEELSEAFSAWRKQKLVGPELADAVIFIAGLAQILDVDLAAEVERKLAVNAEREYVRLPNGTPVKAGLLTGVQIGDGNVQSNVFGGSHHA
jgi:hypothetical protein